MYIDNLSLAELGVSTNNKSGLQSGLILRVQTAINKKIEDLTLSDLRLLISQGIGLPYVVPKALTALEIDCLLEAEHYRGDLLSVVLQIEQEFWLTNPILNNELVDIRIQLDQIIQTASEEIAPLFGTFKYR